MFLSMDMGADTVKDCGSNDSSDESAETVCSVYFRLFEMFISVGVAWADISKMTLRRVMVQDNTRA